MAKAEVIVRFKDIERYKLYMWQLVQLRDQMIIEVNPRAQDLDNIIQRYIHGGDDDRPKDENDH